MQVNKNIKNRYDYWTTQIVFDKEKGDLDFKRQGIPYEIFKDENGNVEIYIPENEYHTGFYIKIPKNS